MAGPDDDEGPGAVRMLPPERDRDQMDFTTVEEGGGWLRAIWPYRQWEELATQSVPPGAMAERWLRDVLVAQVAVELRVDLLVTSSPALLGAAHRWVTHANPMTALQALAVVGLYLRNRGEYPMAVAGPGRITFGEHLLLLSAARAQLPSGWRWGNALVAHAVATDRDAPKFLFQSLHERVVRLLRCRDRIHAALLVPQNNQTANQVTEALDYFMVNIVGAFDAAAHLATGLGLNSQRSAGWQNTAWLRKVRETAPELANLFALGTRPGRVFEICRTLRNTVHGEALHSTAVHSSDRPRQTLVALPEDDAHHLAGLFDQIGGREEWGLVLLARSRPHIEPACLVGRLLPHALPILDDILRLTPVEHLQGVQADRLTTTRAPDDISFGLGTRVRASMLLGLPAPAD